MASENRIWVLRFAPYVQFTPLLSPQSLIREHEFVACGGRVDFWMRASSSSVLMVQRPDFRESVQAGRCPKGSPCLHHCAGFPQNPPPQQPRKNQAVMQADLAEVVF
jgi:hypothetical protein